MNRIEERRNELNISINEICKQVGISRKTYYLYSKVYKPIPSDKLLLLSKCLKCSVDYLLGVVCSSSEGATAKEVVEILSEREDVSVISAETYSTVVVNKETPGIVLIYFP